MWQPREFVIYLQKALFSRTRANCIITLSCGGHLPKVLSSRTCAIVSPSVVFGLCGLGPLFLLAAHAPSNNEDGHGYNKMNDITNPSSFV